MATHEVDPFFQLVADEWRRADIDGDGSLDRKEVAAILGRLNLTVKKKALKKKFNEVDVDKSGTLNFTEFMVFLNKLRNRPEVNAVFAEYSEASDHMTPRQFLRFLHEEQLELDANVADAEGLIHRLEGSDTARFLYLTGFVTYLTSAQYNSWRDPRTVSVCDDMNQPLSHYFISSSHNTYCSGDQLKGNSSVEMYEYVLKKGCRCVELDCWDGPQGEPLIYHGRTLTSKIKFFDVITCIKEHGFTASQYPIVLSIENHCSHEQQAVMASMMLEVFGDMLPPPFTSSRVLPSPASLMGKILLKGKTVLSAAATNEDEYEYDVDCDDEDAVLGDDEEQEEEEASDDDEFDDDDDGDETDELIDDDGDAASDASTRSRSRSALGKLGNLTRRVSSASMRATKGVAKGMARAVTPKTKEKKEKVAADLSELIHLPTVHFKTFAESAGSDARTMSSFSEGKVAKLIKSQPGAMVEYCKAKFARVYPKGTRFDSSNYDPMPAWSVGAQLVALNFQTAGPRMWSHAAFFSTNADSGYRLKPYYMRSPAIEWHAGLAVDHVMTLTITVKSAWQLPRIGGEKGEIIDPYVVIAVTGIAADNATSKTKVVKNNGWNPTWEHTVAFKLRAPELATLMLRVYDSDRFSADDFIAYAGLPVTAIRSGYRHVPLFNYKDVQLDLASLFVNIHIS